MGEFINLLGFSDIINLLLTGCGILVFYKIKRWDSKQDRLEAERRNEIKNLEAKTEAQEQYKMEKMEEREQKRHKDYEGIREAITSLSEQLREETKDRKEKLEIFKKQSGDLDRALLHDALYTDCRRVIDKKHVTLYELENIESLFKAYKSVNGNGTIEKMYNKVIKLPVVTADGDQEF